MNKQEPAITKNDRLKCTSKEGGGKASLETSHSRARCENPSREFSKKTR